jgi:hypothetical protein
MAAVGALSFWLGTKHEQLGRIVPQAIVANSVYRALCSSVAQAETFLKILSPECVLYPERGQQWHVLFSQRSVLSWSGAFQIVRLVVPRDHSIVKMAQS